MLEYAHLAIKLDLEKAIGKVKEACENIQRSTEHVRRKAEGMDIHAMMQRQERLCMSFAQQMYSQIYALGKEIHVRGIPDPFQMRRSKRKFGEEPETYSETMRRRKEENYDLLLDGSRAKILKNAAKAKENVCNETNLLSEERSDYLQVRCVWWMPELAEKAYELQYTPAGVKIYEHWRRTNDVYYLRRNLERFMSMEP